MALENRHIKKLSRTFVGLISQDKIFAVIMKTSQDKIAKQIARERKIPDLGRSIKI